LPAIALLAGKILGFASGISSVNICAGHVGSGRLGHKPPEVIRACLAFRSLDAESISAAERDDFAALGLWPY
jgi:hypothetical protein